MISVAISSLLLVPLASQQVPAQASGAEVDKFLSLGDNSDAGTDPGLNDGLTAGNSTVSASGQRSAGGVIPESSDFSIEAWVHPDSLDNANAWHQVFQQAGTSSSNYGRFGLNLYTNITGLPAGSAGVQVIVDGLNKFTNVETARVYEDRWTHIALTVDAGATTVLKLYLDGNLIATESGAPNGSYNVRSTDFTIGYYPESFDTTDRHFNGGIDQVKVWDGILSDSQVAQSMHSFGSNGVTSAPYLRAHVDFNEDYLDSTENFTFSTVGTVATSTLAATTTDGSDTIVSFPRSYLNSSGGWTVPANVTTADVLVVGGGGAGGSTNYGAAGGGGGGRVLDSTLDLTGVSSVKVTVGQGGIPIAAAASAVAPDTGFDGQSSILVPAGGSEISALGGGGGANARLYSYGQPAPSTTGWTGGGGSAHASSSSSSGSQGIGGSSFEGGDGNPSGTGSYQSGGGGGGAGGLGTDATDGQGGTGGAGISSDIQGGALLLGGGGGGGVRYDSGVPGAGQAGGGSGGDGGDGVSGTANTGGGGGGAGEQSGPNPGGFGGSGIVVVRYTTPVVPSTVQNFSAATRLIDADSDTDSVTLNWDALTGQTPAVTSYEIEYSTASNYAAFSTQSVAVTNASAATPNTVTISGLTDGATYYFRIKARNAVGDSASYAETSSVAVSNADYAVELTSSGQFADSGTGVAVVPASDSSYTIEAWVKPAAVTSETYYVIASQNQLGTGTDANKIFLSLKKDGSSYDLYYSSHTDVAATISLSDSSIPIGDWSHIALVANSTKFQVYVNGVMVSEVSATVTSVNADNAPFSIGSSGGTDPKYQFSGSIDQVKVWNTARSQDQIASSMHVWGATSGDESALLSHYDFNDNTQATTLRDQAGSNDLTYTSVATSDLIPLVEKDTTSRSGYAVYEFKRSYLTATGGWTSEASVSGAEALVVGGGGAGGFARAHSAGGGGGGEVNASTIDLSSGSAVVVKVGQGGVSAIADNGVKAEVVASEIRPTAGQTSELSGITAKPGAFGSSGYTTAGGGGIGSH